MELTGDSLLFLKDAAVKQSGSFGGKKIQAHRKGMPGLNLLARHAG